MIPLETYLRAVWDFVLNARKGSVLNMPHDKETRVFSLRLRTNGTWEVLATHADSPFSSPVNDIVIPLVMPLAPIILVAHVETQWERLLPEAKLEVFQS